VALAVTSLAGRLTGELASELERPLSSIAKQQAASSKHQASRQAAWRGENKTALERNWARKAETI